MGNAEIYKYISIIHDNPEIIVLNSGVLIDTIKCYIYSFDRINTWCVTEEDINFRLFQIKILNQDI